MFLQNSRSLNCRTQAHLSKQKQHTLASFPPKGLGESKVGCNSPCVQWARCWRRVDRETTNKRAKGEGRKTRKRLQVKGKIQAQPVPNSTAVHAFHNSLTACRILWDHSSWKVACFQCDFSMSFFWKFVISTSICVHKSVWNCMQEQCCCDLTCQTIVTVICKLTGLLLRCKFHHTEHRPWGFTSDKMSQSSEWLI